MQRSQQLTESELAGISNIKNTMSAIESACMSDAIHLKNVRQVYLQSVT